MKRLNGSLGLSQDLPQRRRGRVKGIEGTKQRKEEGERREGWEEEGAASGLVLDHILR